MALTLLIKKVMKNNNKNTKKKYLVKKILFFYLSIFCSYEVKGTMLNVKNKFSEGFNSLSS